MRPVVGEFRERKGCELGVEVGAGEGEGDEDDVGLGIDADDDADDDAGVDVDVDVFSFVPVGVEPVAFLLFSTTLGGNSIGSPLNVLNVGLGTLAALPPIPVVFPAPVPAAARAPGIDPEADPELVSSLVL